MIKEQKPISMIEASEYLKSEELKEVSAFIKKFNKLKPEKAKELRKNLESLELMKLNEKSISKLIDVLPKDKDELNKVLLDVKLEDEEIEKVLQIIKDTI